MEQAMIPLFKMKMVQTCFLLCPLTKEYKLIICQYHTGPQESLKIWGEEIQSILMNKVVAYIYDKILGEPPPPRCLHSLGSNGPVATATKGGMAQICFKSLRIHTHGCQGCQKIRNLLRNSKILIARSNIQPKLSKINNH